MLTQGPICKIWAKESERESVPTPSVFLPWQNRRGLQSPGSRGSYRWYWRLTRSCSHGEPPEVWWWWLWEKVPACGMPWAGSLHEDKKYPWFLLEEMHRFPNSASFCKSQERTTLYIVLSWTTAPAPSLYINWGNYSSTLTVVFRKGLARAESNIWFSRLPSPSCWTQNAFYIYAISLCLPPYSESEPVIHTRGFKGSQARVK